MVGSRVVLLGGVTMRPLIGILLIGAPFCFLTRYAVRESAHSLARLADLYREAGVKR